MLVFVSRIEAVQELRLRLVSLGLRCSTSCFVIFCLLRIGVGNGLHGDMLQHERDEAILAFRSGASDILIATDVAG